MKHDRESVDPKRTGYSIQRSHFAPDDKLRHTHQTLPAGRTGGMPKMIDDQNK
jgi:hypothetical protein